MRRLPDRIELRRLRLEVAAAILLASMAAHANPAPIGASSAAPTGLVHANVGFNLVTLLGATSTQPFQVVTPATRGILVEQVGAGYFLRPHLRVQLALWFAETIYGTPSQRSPFALAAVVGWLVYQTGPFFVGGGPVLAPWSYGDGTWDAGLFTAAGVSFRLTHSLALCGVVQMPLFLLRRIAFQITPAVSLVWKF